jgi:hypothetical protein
MILQLLHPFGGRELQVLSQKRTVDVLLEELDDRVGFVRPSLASRSWAFDSARQRQPRADAIEVAGRGDVVGRPGVDAEPVRLGLEIDAPLTSGDCEIADARGRALIERRGSGRVTQRLELRCP